LRIKTGGKTSMKNESLEERLRKYPILRARMEALFALVENEAGDLTRADELEEGLLQELRALGREALQEWASKEQAQVEQYGDQRPDVSRKQKKKLWWHRLCGRVEVAEQSYRHSPSRRQLRPFSQKAGVQCRGYSRPLQRALVDFGADESFGGAVEKLREH
jgi:hypothetical protein